MSEPAPAVLPPVDRARLLQAGILEVTGRLVEASNATFFGEVSLDGESTECVYKPTAGERPLWDFPDQTLAQRERAAYLVAAAFSDPPLVPLTILRDGPLGTGMCQLWIETDPDRALVDVVAPGAVPTGWRSVVEGVGAHEQPVLLVHADDDRLRLLALLDVVVNNADRKGGHVLPGDDGALYAVDHGICFHEENKLRTVLWGFAREAISPDELDSLGLLAENLHGELGRELSVLLTDAEVDATRERCARLLAARRFPSPGGRWPAFPWPPF